MTSEFPPSTLRPVIHEVTTRLKDRNETISVAETAAGGIISSSLLSAPGASAIYKGGLTLYTLESRIAFAGWTPADIQGYTGPTPQVVTGLADNVRGTLGSTYTVCESGTAGPTGGSTRNRTPGYVALAVSTPNGTYTREVETGSGDRERNMVEFAREALKLVVDVLEGRGLLTSILPYVGEFRVRNMDPDVDIMNMNTVNLHRKDTTKGPPLRVLSLDGGGVRGYSMLILIQELMYRIYVECEGKAPRRDQIPKPCDHFDLIAGTGTGGLIALMLGRLRLDLETCKEVYTRMTRRVFETDKTFAGIPYRSTLFKASKLEEAIRECVREHTVFEAEGNDINPASGRSSIASAPYSPNSLPQRSVSRGSYSTNPMAHSTPASQRGSAFINGLRWGNPDALLYDNREYRTKTAVTALYKGTTRNGSSVLLRSYDSRKEPPPEFDCTIWQAGRATSATGLAFKPIQIGQSFFIDEGPGTYNPSPQVLEEAAVNEWPGREVGVFVSVGTGRRPSGTNNRQHEWWEDFFGDTIGVFAEARRRLINKIEGCEDIHHDMLRDHLAKRGVSKDNYYRLNVEVGVGEFGMNEWNRLADISTNTRRYLSKPEVKKMILGAGVKFAKINRMHQRLSAHAANTANDASSIQEDIALLSPHSPTYAVPPPSNPTAVELPAELPGDFMPLPTSANHHVTDDMLPAHPTPQDTVHPNPARGSGSDVSSFRHSHDRSRPTSQQQHHPQPFGSPRHSGDHLHEGVGLGMPPPVPPKTPIPYPDDPVDVVMPVPDTMMHGGGSGGGANGKVRPPYPVDEPPPVVNRHRKPSYHVR